MLNETMRTSTRITQLMLHRIDLAYDKPIGVVHFFIKPTHLQLG